MTYEYLQNELRSEKLRTQFFSSHYPPAACENSSYGNVNHLLVRFCLKTLYSYVLILLHLCMLFVNKFLTLDILSEAVVRKCSVKKVFLNFRKVHTTTPVSKILVNKIAGLEALKRRQRSCFPVDIGKF